jgi:uncharacterized protein YcgI (DUF1989 family)
MIARGAIRAEVVVAPGEPWSSVLRKGEILRIIDMEGQQAV